MTAGLNREVIDASRALENGLGVIRPQLLDTFSGNRCDTRLLLPVSSLSLDGLKVSEESDDFTRQLSREQLSSCIYAKNDCDKLRKTCKTLNFGRKNWEKWRVKECFWIFEGDSSEFLIIFTHFPYFHPFPHISLQNIRFPNFYGGVAAYNSPHVSDAHTSHSHNAARKVREIQRGRRCADARRKLFDDKNGTQTWVRHTFFQFFHRKPAKILKKILSYSTFDFTYQISNSNTMSSIINYFTPISPNFIIFRRKITHFQKLPPHPTELTEQPDSKNPSHNNHHNNNHHNNNHNKQQPTKHPTTTKAPTTAPQFARKRRATDPTYRVNFSKNEKQSENIFFDFFEHFFRIFSIFSRNIFFDFCDFFEHFCRFFSIFSENIFFDFFDFSEHFFRFFSIFSENIFCDFFTIKISFLSNSPILHSNKAMDNTANNEQNASLDRYLHEADSDEEVWETEVESVDWTSDANGKGFGLRGNHSDESLTSWLVGLSIQVTANNFKFKRVKDLQMQGEVITDSSGNTKKVPVRGDVTYILDVEDKLKLWVASKNRPLSFSGGKTVYPIKDLVTFICKCEQWTVTNIDQRAQSKRSVLAILDQIGMKKDIISSVNKVVDAEGSANNKGEYVVVAHASLAISPFNICEYTTQRVERTVMVAGKETKRNAFETIAGVRCTLGDVTVLAEIKRGASFFVGLPRDDCQPRYIGTNLALTLACQTCKHCGSKSHFPRNCPIKSYEMRERRTAVYAKKTKGEYIIARTAACLGLLKLCNYHVPVRILISFSALLYHWDEKSRACASASPFTNLMCLSKRSLLNSRIRWFSQIRKSKKKFQKKSIVNLPLPNEAQFTDNFTKKIRETSRPKKLPLDDQLAQEITLSTLIKSRSHASSTTTSTRSILKKNDRSKSHSITITYKGVVILRVKLSIRKTVLCNQLSKVVKRVLKLGHNACVYFFSADNVIIREIDREVNELEVRLDSTFGADHSNIALPDFIPINDQVMVNQDDVVGASVASIIDGSSVIEAEVVNPQSVDDELAEKEEELVRIRKSNKCFSASYSNIRGHKSEKLYAAATEMLVNGDDSFMFVESNLKETDASIMTSAGLGKWCTVKSLNNVRYEAGKRLSGEKKLAFGTGCVAVDPSKIKKYTDLTLESDLTFEIVPLEVEIAPDMWEARVLVYRSPSMLDLEEVEKFYNLVERYLKHMVESKRFTVITFLGDTNKSNKGFAKKVKEIEKRVVKRYHLTNMIKGINTFMKDNKPVSQPDSVYCWYDVSKIKVMATVNGILHPHCDHRLIRMHYELNWAPPKKRKFYTFERTIRNKDVTDNMLAASLRIKLVEFNRKYANFVFHTGTTTNKENWTEWEDLPNNNRCEVSPQLVDAAVIDLVKLIDEVNAEGKKKITTRLPVEISRHATRQQVKIGQLSALLGEFSLRIMQDPENMRLRAKYQEIEKEKYELMCEITTEKLTSRMKYLDTFNTGTKELFNITKQVAGKEKYKDVCDYWSKEQLEEKLIAHDKTFKNTDPEFGNDIQDFKKSEWEAQRKYTLKPWRPSLLNRELVNYLKKSKMNVDQYIYKRNPEELAYPIYIILRLMEFADHFPEHCRMSKLTFINGGERAIFSLEALTKTLETVLATQLEVCYMEYCAENGDPGQWAYTKNKSCNGVNLIGFTLCDIALSLSDRPVVQTMADLKKAFNSCNRSQILKFAERIAGAGRILFSRYQDRRYKYKDEVRGEDMNRGVDPGCPVSVWEFKVFMVSDKALTLQNDRILFPAPYSDDRAPYSMEQNVVNGDLQSTWDDSSKWAREMGVTYHTEKNNPKKHVFMEYKKKGMQPIQELEDLVLEGMPFEARSTMKELGMMVSTDKIHAKASEIIDKYGYYFLPKNTRLKQIAYRMQQVKDRFLPLMLWDMCNSFFIGIVRCCSALIWCRATDIDMNEVRFYYVMCMAAILNMTTVEIVGEALCKLKSVREDNSRYIKVLELLGLPSVEQMAGTDAVAVTKQVYLSNPEFFNDQVPRGILNKFNDIERRDVGRRSGRQRNTALRIGNNNVKIRSIRNDKVKNSGLPEKLAREVYETDALVGDVWRLACERVIKRVVVDESVRKTYKIVWERAREMAKSRAGKIDYTVAKFAYGQLMRDELGVLCTQERRLSFATPSNRLIPSRLCRVAPPVWTKKRETKFMTCIDSGRSVDARSCKICGFPVCQTKTVKCVACKHPQHRACVNKLNVSTKGFRCGRICRFLGVDASEIIGPKDGLNSAVVSRKKRCLVCGALTNLSSDLVCDNSCNFTAHSACINLSESIRRICCGMSTTEQKTSFVCSDVTYQLRENEVKDCVDAGMSLDSVVRLAGIARIRGKVNTLKYSKSVKRYLNEDFTCGKCGMVVSIDQTEHELRHCVGIQVTPITNKNEMYPMSRMKRMRHLFPDHFI